MADRYTLEDTIHQMVDIVNKAVGSNDFSDMSRQIQKLAGGIKTSVSSSQKNGNAFRIRGKEYCRAESGGPEQSAGAVFYASGKHYGKSGGQHSGGSGFCSSWHGCCCCRHTSLNYGSGRWNRFRRCSGSADRCLRFPFCVGSRLGRQDGTIQ